MLKRSPIHTPTQIRMLYGASTISYSIKNPKLIASLEAARKAGPKPSNQSNTARVYVARSDWPIESVERSSLDADTRIEREEITRLHNRGYNRPSNTSSPAQDLIPEALNLAVASTEEYINYKIYKKIDEILTGDDE